MQFPPLTLHSILKAFLVTLVTACTALAGALVVAVTQDRTPDAVLGWIVQNETTFILSALGMVIFGHLVSEVGRGALHWIEARAHSRR